MSSTTSIRDNAAAAVGPPYVGALLRLPWQAVRNRLLRAFSDAGFGDIGPSHFGVIQYPPPDGVRPIDIAAKAQISKQAANYLIAQLESNGYLRRRTVRGKGRLVFLTAKGKKVADVAHATMRKIELEWEHILGTERYRIFREGLVELTEVTHPDREAEP
ncbi:MAG: MarR family winged helix-turn-helix transcriptional regulator [Vulcanimicrobiaceae bacterium]